MTDKQDKPGAVPEDAGEKAFEERMAGSSNQFRVLKKGSGEPLPEEFRRPRPDAAPGKAE